MARTTQPLEIHQPRKGPEPHQQSVDAGQPTEQQEVTKGIPFNPVQGRDTYGSQRKHQKKPYFWERWAARWKGRKKLDAIEKLTFWLVVLTLFSSGAEVYQSYMMRETFIASQRAAVHLGLPDGKFAELLFGEHSPRIALYFRNYGASAAHYVSADIRTITANPDRVSYPAKWGPPIHSGFGQHVPPESPFTIYDFYHDATKEELSDGRAMVVIGRVVYHDSFEWRCEPFILSYYRDSFRPPEDIPDLREEVCNENAVLPPFKFPEDDNDNDNDNDRPH